MYRRDGLISLFPQTILNEKYRIVRTAGFDKNGITYLAVDEVSGVNYIVFEFAPAGILDRCADGGLTAARDLEEKYNDLKRQFMAEVAAAASVVEPEITEGIVRVIDYFEGNNTGYVVMAMLTDMTLGEWARNRSASSNEAELFIALNFAVRSVAGLNARGYFPTTIHPDSFLKVGDTYRFLCWGNMQILSFPEGSNNLDIESFAAPEDSGLYRVGSPQGCVYSLAAVFYYCTSGLRQPVPVTKSMNDTGKFSDPVTKLVINKALRQLPARRYTSVPDFWLNLRMAIFQGKAEDYDDGVDDTDQIKTSKLMKETSDDTIGNAREQNLQMDAKKSETTGVYGNDWQNVSTEVSWDMDDRLYEEDYEENSVTVRKKNKWLIPIVAGGSILLLLFIFIIVVPFVKRIIDRQTNVSPGFNTSSSGSTDENEEIISGTFYIISKENEANCLQTMETAVNSSKLFLAEYDTDSPVDNALFDIIIVTEGEKSGYVLRCHSNQSGNSLTSEDYVLSVKDQAREDGAALCQREYRRGEDQFWQIIKTEDDCYYLESVYGTCIDASNFESAGVRLRENEGSFSQKWILVKMPE